METLEKDELIQQKYTPLFTNANKSLKIVLTKQKNGSYKPNGALMKQFDKVLFCPLTSNRDEIFNSILCLFGNSYNKYLKQYTFPRRYIFNKNLIKGPIIRKNLDKNYIKEYIKSRFPSYKGISMDKILTKKSAVIDYTDIIQAILPKAPEYLKRTAVKVYSEYIYPEIIARLFMKTENEEDLNTYVLTKGLTIISGTGEEQNYSKIGFERIIIPIKINLSNIRPITLNFLSGTTALPIDLKTNPDIIYDFSIFKFLIKVLQRDYVEEDQPNSKLVNSLIQLYIKHNPIFYFYNSKFGFIFDIKELTESMNWNNQRIIKRFIDCIKYLVRFNTNDLPEEELDEILLAEDEEETENKKEQQHTIKDALIHILDTSKVKSTTDKISNLIENIINSPDKKRENIISNLTRVNNELGDPIPENELESSKYNELFSSLSNIKEDLNNEIDYSSNEQNDEEIEADEDENFDNIDDENDIDNYQEPEEQKDFDSRIDEFENDIIEDIVAEPISDQESDLAKKKFLEAVRKEQLPELSSRQIARLREVRTKYTSIKYKDKTLQEILEDTTSTSIDHNKIEANTIDKSFQNINIVDFEKSYLEKTLERDIINCLMSFSSPEKDIKLYITDYKKEDTSDQFNEKETITVKFEDDNQVRHSIKFDIPKIDDDFRVMVNGNKKIFKKQILFLPLVKISPNLVWLTSQYNKMYIERIDYVINRNTFILKHLVFNHLNTNNNCLIELGNSKNKNSKYLTTIEYDELSEKIISIILFPNDNNKKIYISFSQDKIREIIKNEFKDHKLLDNKLPFAIDYSTKKIYEINPTSTNTSISDIILNIIKTSGLISDYDNIIKEIKTPKRKSYTRILLLSKKTPLIIFLGYLFGLKKVLDKAKIDIENNIKPKKDPNDHRAYIRFKDCYLYYDYYPIEKSLLLNGLNYMRTEDIELHEMESREVYTQWLYEEYDTRNIAKGWEDFRELFLDAITLEILRDMNLPTDLLELLLYANDLLGNNSFQHESSGDIQELYRIRCHEVIVESIYKCLANQYKLLRKAKDPTKVSLSMPQDAVMARLMKLTTFNNHDITNPLNELKQKGIVSFKGSTGINESRAFNLEKRAYGKYFTGIVALSAPDNAQVGITKQLSANPNITSTRGYVKTYKNKKDLTENITASELVSIEEAAYPYAMEKDDPKRLSYMSGQTMHTMKTSGAVPPIVRSPVDKIIAGATSETFANKAKNDGKIISIDEENKKIFIEYIDGKKDFIQYGNEFARNSSFFFTLNKVPNVKSGQKIKKNDILAYDKDFFEKEGNELIYKQGPLAYLCINESDSTEEDSSFVTEQYTEKMKTNVTMAKGIVLPPNTNLISYKKIGDHVLINDPLMVFEDTDDYSVSAVLDLLGDLDEETKMETMQKSPRADHSGEITDMKVYWTVPESELSPSLQKFVNDYKKKLMKEIKIEEEMTGNTSKKRLELEMSTVRLGRIKKYLVPEEGGVVIEYFTSHEESFKSGDKQTFNTSLKAIIASVVSANNAPYTESGLVLDGVISLLSIQARHINSIWYVGFLTNILLTVSHRLSDYYFE